MKHFTAKLSMLMGAVALLFAACDKTPADNTKPVKFEITSDASVEIDAEGGELVIEYTIENPKKGASVMATTNAAWISDNDASYSTDGRIVLVVEANDKEWSRMAKIEVRYDTIIKSVNIEQLGAKPTDTETPVVSLEGTPVEVPSEGGSFLVNYSVENAVEGIDAVPTTTAEWIENLTANDGEIRFDVAAYEEFEAREAVVEVAYEGAESVEFIVTQKGITRPELIVSPNSVNAAAAGGDYSVNYVVMDAIEGEELKLTCSQQWIEATPSKYTIDITVAANESPEPREATITVEYRGAEAVEVVVSQAAKQATTKSVAIDIVSAMMAVDYGGEFELHFNSSEGKVYVFDIYADLSGGYIPDGLYTMTDGTLDTRYCVHEYGTLNAKMKGASLESRTADGQTKFDASWSYNDVVYTIEWTGVVDGFDYNISQGGNDGTATVIAITSASVEYDKAGEKEINFITKEEVKYRFNFKHADITVGNPIADGTYSSDEGTMNLNYCKHDIDGAYGTMSSTKATITNDYNKKSSTFIIEWVYEGNNYKIEYTGSVTGYNYENVAGQTLDFTPTYVEMTDAGFAGLYFYFYDADENELVLNYDRNQVYMPYINYEGTKLEIDNTDYTFEYTDNGDGTYTYNARFVTLDGRIIEFSGPLPTSVS